MATRRRARLGGQPERGRRHLVVHPVGGERHQDRPVLDLDARGRSRGCGASTVSVSGRCWRVAVDDVDDHADRQPDDADRRDAVAEVQRDRDQQRGQQPMNAEHGEQGHVDRSRPEGQSAPARASSRSGIVRRIWITDACASVNESIAPKAYRFPRNAVAPVRDHQQHRDHAVEDDRHVRRVELGVHAAGSPRAAGGAAPSSRSAATRR